MYSEANPHFTMNYKIKSVHLLLLTLDKSLYLTMSKNDLNRLNTHTSNTSFFKKFKKIVYMVGLGIFLLLSTFEVRGQGSMEYTVFHYPNGTVSSEGFMQDGKPNGYWKTFYPNGNLKSEGNRNTFQLDSTWAFYAENGEIMNEIDYRFGERHGTQVNYKDGVKYEVSQFCEDVKCDATTFYYPTGEKQRVVPFSEGKENGDGFEYDLEGTIITLLNYRDGNLRRADKINRYDNRGNKRGPWIYYHPNGIIAEEGFYMNDKKNGIFKAYDKKGDLLTLEKYRDGELVTDSEESVILDLRNTYFSDGTVKSSGGYVDGKKEGTHRVYDERGEISGGEVYRKGSKVAEGIVDLNGGFEGQWKLFYESGTLKAEGEYKDSERTGEWIFYHENGKIQHKGKYLNGLPQGEWKWYYEDSKLRREEYYRRGREDGSAVEYGAEGKIITQGEYVGGLREGEWFYEVGDHIEKGSYVDGERQGEWIYEYTDGSTNYKGKYVAGLPVGKHMWYHPNEKLKMEGKYSSGVRTGTWKKYDELGVEVLNIKYKQGREVKINGKRIISEEGVESLIDVES